MARMKRVLSVVGTLLIAAGAPATVHAQGSARSLDIDPSVRAAGMGAASNAVFWEGGNQWANPALLGQQRGIRYEWGDTKLVPDITSDIHFRSNVVKFGGSGLGLALSGKPAIGGLKLDYGTSEGSDDQGNLTTFDTFEDIESWGIGASLGQVTEGIAKLFGRETPALSRYGDVSLGMYSKDVKIQIAADATGKAHGSAHDRGVLVRISPLEWFAASRDALVDLDLAYGWSELSYDGKDVVYVSSSTASPPTEHHRRGFALRGGLDWPEQARHAFGEGAWWVEGLRPMLTVGAAFDHEENTGYDTDGHGYEIGLANVVAYRFGSYEEVGFIDGSTSGWSVGLPIGRLAGVRYDEARFPQAQVAGPSKLERKAFTAWIDPLEIWSFMRR